MIKKERIVKYCDRVTRFSLYGMAFYIPISTALIESFAGLAIAAWLLKKVLSGGGVKKIFSGNVLALPVLIYLLVCFVSSVFSSSPWLSFRHLIFKTIEYALLFFIVVDIADRKFMRNILAVLIISVGLVGIDGIFQHFSGVDFFRGRTPVIVSRINGPFTAPNDFANYIVTLLPLAASLSFVKFKKTWLVPALRIISLVLFICLVLAASRSAWVALLSVVTLFLFLNRRLAAILILLIVSTLVFISLSPASTARSRISDLFSGNKTTVFSDRPFLLETGMNMFAAAPVVGQGLGTFMFNFDKFKPVPLTDYPYEWGISYAHNCFLQIASETGLLGLLSFLAVIIALFCSSFRRLRKTEGSDYFILSGLLAGLFTYLASSFFDTNLYSLPLAVLFWLMLGLSAAAGKIIKESYSY
ncbi:MAG: O-antigen ligase family protein [Candidatus Omnitrophota bacterium]